MNRTLPSLSSRRTPLSIVAVASLAAVVSGCARDRAFTINGQVITKDEYIKTLERQPVNAAGTSTTALRAALDALVGNQVILADAAKDKVMPSSDEVAKYYNTEKRLWEEQNPGKDYEKSMGDVGTTPADIQSQMTVQLAESAVYAQRLGVTEGDIRNAYNMASQHGGVGLPARVQLRFLIPSNVADFQEAQKLLAQPNADFDAAAAKVNIPVLRAQGGLWPQTVPLTNLGAVMQSKFDHTPEGGFFGPIDFVIQKGRPAVKAWVKIEKKLPGLGIPFADARELVRTQLVQIKLRDPANQSIRQGMIQEKLGATLDGDSRYTTAWTAYKANMAQAIANQQAAAATSAGSILANPDSATTSLTK